MNIAREIKSYFLVMKAVKYRAGGSYDEAIHTLMEELRKSYGDCHRGEN